MAHAQASIGTVDYATAITIGHHRLIVDEGPELGGKDAGPAPYDLLSSALGACTVITLRMYAERKQWPVTAVQAGKSRLTARGKKLIDAIRGQYAGVPVGAEFTPPATTVGVKSGG